MSQQFDLFGPPVTVARLTPPPPAAAALPIQAPTESIPYDEGYEEDGWLTKGMRSIAMLWPMDKLREKAAFFSDAEGLAGGVQKMQAQNMPAHLIERRIANVARLASIMAQVLAEREASG